MAGRFHRLLWYVSHFLKWANNSSFLDPKYFCSAPALWASVLPYSARARLSALLTHPRTQFLLSFLSSNKSILPPRQTLSCLFFTFYI